MSAETLSYYYLTTQRDDLLSHLSTSKEYKQMVLNVSKNSIHWRDLFQEMFLHLCELPAEKLLEIESKGYLRFYCVRFLNNQFNSDRSPFYRNYKNFSPIEYGANKMNVFIKETEGDNQLDELGYYLKGKKEKRIELIESVLDSLDWYERELWKYRAENDMLSYTKMNQQIGISRSSIIDTCLKVERLIIKKLQEAGLYE